MTDNHLQPSNKLNERIFKIIEDSRKKAFTAINSAMVKLTGILEKKSLKKNKVVKIEQIMVRLL